MAKVHGKHTFVSIDGDDISTYTNSTVFNRSADSHDTTTYGPGDSHEFDGGLTNGTVTIGGFYDNTAGTGPSAVIEPLLRTKVVFIYQIEGTGSGKPQKECTVLVTAFNESSPVADYVTWTAELQISGDVDLTPQAV